MHNAVWRSEWSYYEAVRICVSFAILTFSIGHYGFAIGGDDPAICTSHIVHHIVPLGAGEFSHPSSSQFTYKTELKWSVNTLMSSLHMPFLSISSTSVWYCPTYYRYISSNVSYFLVDCGFLTCPIKQPIMMHFFTFLKLLPMSLSYLPPAEGLQLLAFASLCHLCYSSSMWSMTSCHLFANGD